MHRYPRKTNSALTQPRVDVRRQNTSTDILFGVTVRIEQHRAISVKGVVDHLARNPYQLWRQARYAGQNNSPGQTARQRRKAEQCRCGWKVHILS